MGSSYMRVMECQRQIELIEDEYKKRRAERQKPDTQAMKSAELLLDASNKSSKQKNNEKWHRGFFNRKLVPNGQPCIKLHDDSELSTPLLESNRMTNP